MIHVYALICLYKRGSLYKGRHANTEINLCTALMSLLQKHQRHSYNSLDSAIAGKHQQQQDIHNLSTSEVVNFS